MKRECQTIKENGLKYKIFLLCFSLENKEKARTKHITNTNSTIVEKKLIDPQLHAASMMKNNIYDTTRRLLTEKPHISKHINAP